MAQIRLTVALIESFVSSKVTFVIYHILLVEYKIIVRVGLGNFIFRIIYFVFDINVVVVIIVVVVVVAE